RKGRQGVQGRPRRRGRPRRFDQTWLSCCLDRLAHRLGLQRQRGRRGQRRLRSQRRQWRGRRHLRRFLQPSVQRLQRSFRPLGEQQHPRQEPGPGRQRRERGGQGGGGGGGGVCGGGGRR